jgi:hypothetical protein
MPDVQNSNLSKIIKRLELIKSLISLEEEDEIDAYMKASVMSKRLISENDVIYDPTRFQI